MKNSKKLYIYNNRIIFINGSSIKQISTKFTKNYYENFNYFLKKKKLKFFLKKKIIKL